MNMTDVVQIKKKMLFLAIASVAVLIVLTVAIALSYNTANDSGLVFYMMAAPIILTALAFVFGYLDIDEKMKDDDISYMVHRSYIFGGILFAISLLVLIALYFS